MAIIVRRRRYGARRAGRRRVGGLRRRMGRKSLAPQSKVHFHKKTVYIRNWQTSSSSAGFSVARTFQLSDLGGEVASLSALYQLFCLKAVKVEVIPQANSNELGQSGAPSVHSVIDYVNNTASATTALMEYASYKSTRGQRSHMRYLKPRVQDTIYSGGITPAYASHKSNQWLSMETNNSIGCPHFGLKLNADAIQVGGDLTMFYDLKTTYYLAFKSTK